MFTEGNKSFFQEKLLSKILNIILNYKWCLYSLCFPYFRMYKFK